MRVKNRPRTLVLMGESTLGSTRFITPGGSLQRRLLLQRFRLRLNRYIRSSLTETPMLASKEVSIRTMKVTFPQVTVTTPTVNPPRVTGLVAPSLE